MTKLIKSSSLLTPTLLPGEPSPPGAPAEPTALTPPPPRGPQALSGLAASRRPGAPAQRPAPRPPVRQASLRGMRIGGRGAR